MVRIWSRASRQHDVGDIDANGVVRTSSPTTSDLTMDSAIQSDPFDFRRSFMSRLHEDTEMGYDMDDIHTIPSNDTDIQTLPDGGSANGMFDSDQLDESHHNQNLDFQGHIENQSDELKHVKVYTNCYSDQNDVEICNNCTDQRNYLPPERSSCNGSKEHNNLKNTIKNQVNEHQIMEDGNHGNEQDVSSLDIPFGFVRNAGFLRTIVHKQDDLLTIIEASTWDDDENHLSADVTSIRQRSSRKSWMLMIALATILTAILLVTIPTGFICGLKEKCGKKDLSSNEDSPYNTNDGPTTNNYITSSPFMSPVQSADAEDAKVSLRPSTAPTQRTPVMYEISLPPTTTPILWTREPVSFNELTQSPVSNPTNNNVNENGIHSEQGNEDIDKGSDRNDDEIEEIDENQNDKSADVTKNDSQDEQTSFPAPNNEIDIDESDSESDVYSDNNENVLTDDETLPTDTTRKKNDDSDASNKEEDTDKSDGDESNTNDSDESPHIDSTEGESNLEQDVVESETDDSITSQKNSTSDDNVQDTGTMTNDPINDSDSDNESNIDDIGQSDVLSGSFPTNDDGNSITDDKVNGSGNDQGIGEEKDETSDDDIDSETNENSDDDTISDEPNNTDNVDSEHGNSDPVKVETTIDSDDTNNLIDSQTEEDEGDDIVIPDIKITSPANNNDQGSDVAGESDDKTSEGDDFILDSESTVSSGHAKDNDFNAELQTEDDVLTTSNDNEDDSIDFESENVEDEDIVQEIDSNSSGKTSEEINESDESTNRGDDVIVGNGPNGDPGEHDVSADDLISTDFDDPVADTNEDEDSSSENAFLSGQIDDETDDDEHRSGNDDNNASTDKSEIPGIIHSDGNDEKVTVTVTRNEHGGTTATTTTTINGAPRYRSKV